jgi:hypothetical protein
MNKILIREYKKLIKQGYDSLSIYFLLRKIDDKLTLKKYSDYENNKN